MVGAQATREPRRSLGPASVGRGGASVLAEVATAVVAPLGCLGGGDELGATVASVPPGPVGGGSVLRLRAAEGLAARSAGFTVGNLPLLCYRGSAAASTEGVVGQMGGEPDPTFVAPPFIGRLPASPFGLAGGLANAVAVTMRVPRDCAGACGAPREIQNPGERSGCSAGRPGMLSGGPALAVIPTVRAAVDGVPPVVVPGTPHAAGSTDAPLRSGGRVGPALSRGHHRSSRLRRLLGPESEMRLRTTLLPTRREFWRLGRTWPPRQDRAPLV